MLQAISGFHSLTDPFSPNSRLFRPQNSWFFSWLPALIENLGQCNGIVLIFVLGLSDVPGEAMVKLYCPKCMDVYTPKSSRHHHTDGAYFGTGFPHMLFMVHPEYRPKRPANQFVPRYSNCLILVDCISTLIVIKWFFYVL